MLFETITINSEVQIMQNEIWKLRTQTQPFHRTPSQPNTIMIFCTLEMLNPQVNLFSIGTAAFIYSVHIDTISLSMSASLKIAAFVTKVIHNRQEMCKDMQETLQSISEWCEDSSEVNPPMHVWCGALWIIP